MSGRVICILIMFQRQISGGYQIRYLIMDATVADGMDAFVR